MADLEPTQDQISLDELMRLMGVPEDIIASLPRQVFEGGLPDQALTTPETPDA